MTNRQCSVWYVVALSCTRGVVAAARGASRAIPASASTVRSPNAVVRQVGLDVSDCGAGRAGAGFKAGIL